MSQTLLILCNRHMIALRNKSHCKLDDRFQHGINGVGYVHPSGSGWLSFIDCFSARDPHDFGLNFLDCFVSSLNFVSPSSILPFSSNSPSILLNFPLTWLLLSFLPC